MHLKKAKILFLMQLPPPVHGASMVNELIYKSININSKFDCTFLNISTAEDLSDIGKFRVKKIFSFLTLLWNVLRYSKTHNPDRVYITLSPHGKAFYKDAIIVYLCKKLKKKIIVHLHGKGIKSSINNKFKKWIYKSAFKNVDIIHLSKLLEFDIESVYDRQSSIYFLANGITDYVPNFNDDFKEIKVIRIIYLSNFIPTKGALLAIKAVHNLILMGISNVKIDLIGKSSNSAYYETLRQYVVNNKITDFVTFYNGKYGDDKIAALMNSSVFILPTENDCFPISIIEAMMCGLPIISTMEGAIPELVKDNNCGLLSPSNDVESLTNNLKEIVTNAELRLYFSKNARRAFLEKYTSEKFEHSFIQIIEKLTYSNEHSL